MDATFVFSIESGYIEGLTLLAIESLRRFGGKLANLPVLAITPRFGPPLARETRRQLDELGVTYLRSDARHPLSWYMYLTKPLVLMLAEEYLSSEQIFWLDSDILVATEPELLWLEPEIDFAGCATDISISTRGPGDENEAYWIALCRRAGLDIDQLPWVETQVERQWIRYSLNGGVFAYRRDKRFGKAYLAMCEQLLASRITHPGTGLILLEQVTVGLTAIASGLRWRMLPESHNYQLIPDFHDAPRSMPLAGARLLHYHHDLSTSESTAWLLSQIQDQLPELYDWLCARLPVQLRRGGLHSRVLRRALREWRDLQQKQFLMRASPYG